MLELKRTTEDFAGNASYRMYGFHNEFDSLREDNFEEGYYEGHQYFQIFCEDKIYRYQIFAYQVVNTDSFIFKEKFTSPTELAAKIMENSMINPGIEINEDDKIVNLITCTDDTLRRFVVSAVLVETYNRTDGTLIKN